MQILTVTQFIAYLNDTFKAVWDVQAAAIEGEVSSYRVSQGQWVSFDLKDSEGIVNIFIPLWKQTLPLQDGMTVRVFGSPRIYGKYGKFSFSAERIELTGEGTLRKALALLRQKLEAEGLFDPVRKRQLPRFPSRIALIASRESAAYGDFVRILNERWRGLEVEVYHVHVQGEKAPPEIVAALQTAQRRHEHTPYDAIVLTRGGGSFEELVAFNDERVVRALFGSKIPTLVGIGHERDLTLAEEVADVRGSTPTDCARRVAPDRQDVLFELAALSDGIETALLERLVQCRRQISDVLSGADHWLERVRFTLEASGIKIEQANAHWLERLGSRLATISHLLVSLDPRAVVKRGYVIVRDATGRVQPAAQMLQQGMTLNLEFRDGEASTVVDSIRPKLI